jgi:hypothetical protein
MASKTASKSLSKSSRMLKMPKCVLLTEISTFLMLLCNYDNGFAPFAVWV